MTKVKTIIMLDERFFNPLQQAELEEWLNKGISYDRYKVLLCPFPATDPGMMRTLEVGEKQV